jgi:lipopolysaccharide/colanic/teichoic acid biosynthesis glycosyltransferase
MYLETYPLAIKAGQEKKLVYENTRKSTLTFLYIGKNEDTLQYFSSYFKSGFFVEGFSEARLAIDSLQLNNGNLPDAIIIDIPFHKSRLENFCNFLDVRSLLAKTILVYSEKSLAGDEVKFLQRTDFVDDVVDINSWKINFSHKISFLKKLKNQRRVLSLGKNSHNNNAAETDSIVVGKRFSAKRLFDIVIASLLIILSLPVLVILAILIKLESKGPIIYASPRAGQGFKIFKFYKFRTMEVDADKKIEALAHLNQYKKNENGAKFLKICNDPRVTRIGKFLRKTSLDELPQFYNVLIGDMSLVGNRPLPIYEASTLTTNEFVERFMAPAGITGLWQIKKRGKANMSVEERIELDISYARNASILTDMLIIARTPVALFQKCDV